MEKKYNLKREQIKFLKDLEDLIGKSIPYVHKIESDTFGVKIEGKNIVGLGLYYQGLTTLPKSIGEVSSLQELYLYYNQLTILPESIGELSSLEKLRLFSNKLTILPESIGKLSSLQELYLSFYICRFLERTQKQLGMDGGKCLFSILDRTRSCLVPKQEILR